MRSEKSLQKLANNVILSEAEGSLKQRKISRRHIKRYFTALCIVQYDNSANNVILYLQKETKIADFRYLRK